MPPVKTHSPTITLLGPLISRSPLASNFPVPTGRFLALLQRDSLKSAQEKVFQCFKPHNAERLDEFIQAFIKKFFFGGKRTRPVFCYKLHPFFFKDFSPFISNEQVRRSRKSLCCKDQASHDYSISSSISSRPIFSQMGGNRLNPLPSNLLGCFPRHSN